MTVTTLGTFSERGDTLRPVQGVTLLTAAGDPAASGSDTTAANQVTGNNSLASIDTKITGLATSANQTSELTKLDQLHTDLIAATPAGTNIIGKVGIDTAANAVAATGNVASGATDSGNPVKAGGVYNSTTPTLTAGQRGDVQMGSRGSLNVTLFTADSTNSIGSRASNVDGVAASSTASNLSVSSFGAIFNGTTWDRARKPNSIARLASSAATTNATSAKATAGDLYSITGYNATASVKYLKLYNKASAPTVGTDTPLLTIAIPPNSPIPPNNMWAAGLYFSAGIAYALTGAAVDSDTTALAAADVVGLNISYQ